MLRHRPGMSLTVYFSFCLPDCSKVIKPFTCDQLISMWPIYLFVYRLAVILYTLWFSMVIVFICSNRGLLINDFNFYVMGKKYMLSLLSAILVLCNRVESSKIISSCFHFGWQNVSTYFIRFVKID